MLNRNGKFPKNWILCERVLKPTPTPSPRLVLSLLSDYSSTSAISIPIPLATLALQPSTYNDKHSTHLNSLNPYSHAPSTHLNSLNPYFPSSSACTPTASSTPPARLQRQQLQPNTYSCTNPSSLWKYCKAQ